jgi:D-alanyl-D-alanine carboxypeptidase
MFRSVGGSRSLRFGALAVSAAVFIVTVGSDSADARGRHHRAKHASAPKHHRTLQASRSSYEPPYAAIVVDANSGRILHASNPDSERHPASITKIMTLYLLFEQLETGKLRLDSELEVSAHAASQAPSKLGLRPGQTITVEDAIKAVVTKSANDIAVTIAEAIGGTEADFATLMTRKARTLGMSHTNYANASGLPNDDQITTARDQALLGRAIQDRFPRYYRYFSTLSFAYKGHAIRNHNHLLGNVPGVDGIKTGFIRASGFNLVASVRRSNRHLVAVVMGGSSAGSRDARMRSLIEEYIAQCATERTAPRIQEPGAAVAQMPAQAKPQVLRAEPAAEQNRYETASAASEPVVSARLAQVTNQVTNHVTNQVATPSTTQAIEPRQQVAEPAHFAERMQAVDQPRAGSTAPIKAIRVKTLAVRAANTPQNAAMAALAGAAATAPAALHAAPVNTYQTASAVSAPAPIRTAAASETAPQSIPASAKARGGWVIQIGAFPDEAEAREHLQSAQSMAKSILGHADAFTERVTKGRETLYRARFAGLDEDGADAACRHFKRNKIACFAMKN